ncbi:regulator of complement activation group 2 gene 1 isoform X3 [Siphateles boraxobius]|uniref:regulator of complement activation group 2 gene 1 isoform X3 n=1 Tax=Siphateles boraxobius TaxID=180520 RepID=UPI0040631EE8
MGCKVLWLNVALLPYLMICVHVRAQCTQPSFASSNVILSASHLSTGNFPDGSAVTFECDIGYKPVNSRASKSVTCEGNQWTSLELICTRKSCGSPPEFDNGRYEITGILFGDNITAVCNTGYMLDGLIKVRLCRDQGWDGRDPVCEVVKCKAPPAIVNGQLEEEPLDSYDYLQAVSYRCISGFSISGTSTLHCSEDGTFKPDPPKCSDGCPKPEIPHATRIGGKSPPYSIGNFLNYKCNNDYTMKGESYIVCGLTGWNPEPPKCIGPCGRPDLSGHVTLIEEFRTQNSFPYGSKVTFECIKGYEPVDSTVSKSVTCEENNWTERIFTCKGVKCKAPPAIVNGHLVEKPLDSYDYLQAVSYRCNSGFTINGSSTLHCSEDGTFKPDPPKCLEGSETSPSSTTVIAVVVSLIGFAVVGICAGVFCVYKKKRSKHEYSHKVATKTEEGEL